MRELLFDVAERAARYLEELDDRGVAPGPAVLERLEELGGELPEGPTDTAEVLALLDEVGSPATIGSAGGRYFGFVTGGVLPTALAAHWLAGAWDQNAFGRVSSPLAARLEEIAGEWVVDLLGLPAETASGFVTGATMANLAGLAAARHRLLERRGWDVEERGLFGAPDIPVIVGDEVHVSLLKALSILGLGRSRVRRVPVDDQGRLRADRLGRLEEGSLVCVQAGNVNTGAFDPAEEVCERTREAGGWVHVDGAFGLWALASPSLAPLADGVAGADSWATDAHKWLNVPYDSGLVLCRDGDSLRAAMAATRAAYLMETTEREPCHFTPEMSRRARGVEVWAALRSLGRKGVASLVERCCRLADRFAEGLRREGFEIPHDVVLNQVLVRFGSDEETWRVIDRLQRDGVCWCGGTEWQGRAAMRISVSSWATTEADVDASLEAIRRAAGRD